MKRMLINATQKEELRIALVNKKKLYDLNIENTKNKQNKFNIYKGKITKIEPSLEAVFVDYGYKKNGFLPIKEITKEYFLHKNKKKNFLKKSLYKGQELIIQINKDERGKKRALLTTFISLIGSNIILMPNNPKANGISKRIEGKERNKIKSFLKKIKLPKNMGLIIRTAGINKSLKTLQLDLYLKIKHWKYIKKKAKKNNAPFLIHKENDIFIRIFRDYLYQDINEIIIDNYKIYKLSINYIKKLGKKDFIKKIKFYNKDIPLFSYFKIEKQIESAFKRKVTLPSGGSIIIDVNETLTSIDINSSKSTKWKNIETTALNTNLEATEEITKQLRLRNVGGLIVIDFIDMNLNKNKKIIKNKLKKLIKDDRAKIQLGYISKFCLLEMSRQRLNKSLNESSYYICSRCKGSGIIRKNKSLSLSILRIIENESLKKNIKEIHAIVPIKIGFYLLNNKRNNLYEIEKRKKNKIKIIILPNEKFKIPNYNILKIKKKKIKNKKKNNSDDKNINNLKKKLKIKKKKYIKIFYFFIKKIYKKINLYIYKIINFFYLKKIKKKTSIKKNK